MIGKIKGKIELIDESSAVIWAGSVGYLIHSLDFPPDGYEAEYFIHTVLKEEDESLYAFENKEDLDYFRFLLSLSGVGAKSAFLIMKQFSKEEIEENPDVLKSVRGIGQKTLETIKLKFEKSKSR